MNKTKVFLKIFNIVIPILLLLLTGYLLYGCYNSVDIISLSNSEITDSDRCIVDVIHNDGILRLPLPEWKTEANSDVSHVYMYNKGKIKKTISEDILQKCNEITNSKHSNKWRNYLEYKWRNYLE